MDKKTWLGEFGNNLQSLMSEEGITQAQLAEESGICQSDISRYINGQQFPGIKAVVNIAYALDRNIDELLDFDEMID